MEGVIVADLDYSTVVSIMYFKCLHNMHAGISDSVEEKLTTFGKNIVINHACPVIKLI